MPDERIPIPLRALRQRLSLSLSQAAERTGVSKAMLGQIERGESSPTIATLWRLAKGLHLPLTALLPESPVAPAHAAPVRFPGSITVQPVFPFDPLTGSETFLVTLEPGQEHLSQAHDAGVVEQVFVTDGTVEILRGEVWTPCPRHQGLRFAADQPHGYRNPGIEAARFLNVMHYTARL